MTPHEISAEEPLREETAAEAQPPKPAQPFKRFLAIGTGVGIEIGARDLHVVMVRVRPSGVQLIASMTVERYAERPAAEWGAEYTAFLKKNGGSYLAATVLLPRQEVIIRQISLPGVADRDMAQAVRFQLDGLHPYNEDEPQHDWARIGKTGEVLVGISRRQTIDRYVTLFSEAGVKVSSFTFSAAAIYGAVRLLSDPPASGLMAMEEHDGQLEVYGESEARPMFSTTFDAPNAQLAARARSRALSELRLPPDTEAQPIDAVLPQPKALPEDVALATIALPYAAAIASACPRRMPRVNLLPEALRANASRMIYVPSIVLGVLLLGGLAALPLYRSYEDQQYLRSLQAEIRKLEPLAVKPMQMERQIDMARDQVQLLDDFRRRTRADMDVLNELTRILPPPTWVKGLEVTRDAIRLSGESPQATGLLKVIDESPLFEGSTFNAPMARIGNSETFGIQSRREKRPQ